MMKINKAIHTAAALLAVALLTAGCSRDDLEPQPQPDSGFVKLEFRADVPEPEVQSLGTRAVDPDGGGVRDMTLFCFDNFGLFVTTVSATMATTGNMEGSFTAEVPTHTRRIHFVANQNMTDFRESSFINKSESEVMALLEGSAGHMIYWARFACAPLADPMVKDPPTIAEELEDWLKAHDGKITMLRNHALVTIANPTIDDIGGQQGNGVIEITGMAACNIQAFGTVAPYDPERGFDFTLEDWKQATYVTIPQRDAKQSDIMDVTANTSQFIFEHRNSSDDPVSIILRGHKPGQTSNDDLYYRVMLVDASGDFIPVRRNYRYTLTINGALSFGQPTFEAALTAAATNNVWVSISDNVNEVEDQNYVLHVDQTFVVLNEADIADLKSYTLGYSVKGKGGRKITLADKPDVTWIDNTVAAQTITNKDVDFKINTGGDTATGLIGISIRSLGANDRLEGTLLVKKGRLQRKIKIVLIKKQSFAPSWISTGIYGGADVSVVTSRPHVTLMFTVPESCPAELFPMNVYITASGLDIRNASGMSLPVVRAGDTQWYSSDDGPGNADYKFVLTVEQSGPQRVYFENILNPQEGAGPGEVYIEAPHFATVRRTYTFANTTNAISVENTGTYSAANISQGASDEYIYYYRVAQKTGAPVHFNMLLHKKTGEGTSEVQGDPINADPKDEFLFYSSNLTNYNADEGEIEIFDCFFSRFNDRAAAWQQKQNSNGGRMLMFMPKDPTNPRNGTGKYVLYMYTNCARSAEVVRISSNLNTQPSVLNFDAATQSGPAYEGTIYRSFVFELANYTPFRFGARVRYNNGDWTGGADEPDRSDPSADVPEKVTDLTWTFEPEKRVDIAIDVTSFAGLADTRGEDTEADRVSVDPFGREFEIYIDAPMLKLDESRFSDFHLNGDKLKADPNVPGRFIYTVEADREAERAFGAADALNTDAAAAAGAQAGERKILPFVVNSVASAGDIVISSNKQQIVFYDKTFRVTNESIKGRIVYEVENPDGSTTQTPVPNDLFVAFERVTNSNRIGSVTMTGEGEFELRLRKEYPLQWRGYAVAFHFEHGEHLHHAQYTTLADMYEAIKSGETVVLKREPLR